MEERLMAWKPSYALAPISKAARMLAEATTLEEIRQVENLAQRARDYAKAAGLGRDASNSAARIMLDARRKTGETLATMKERGELATKENGGVSQAATPLLTLTDLGLTRSQSSRYQQEASAKPTRQRVAPVGVEAGCEITIFW
jgi:hypothetical protein